jgi:hypothetical protein
MAVGQTGAKKPTLLTTLPPEIPSVSWAACYTTPIGTRATYKPTSQQTPAHRPHPTLPAHLSHCSRGTRSTNCGRTGVDGVSGGCGWLWVVWGGGGGVWCGMVGEWWVVSWCSGCGCCAVWCDGFVRVWWFGGCVVVCSSSRLFRFLFTAKKQKRIGRYLGFGRNIFDH